MSLVSIIMPAYNAQEFIDEAIESVILQTYNNWELIIINDGSTDNTQQIANRYVAQDARVKLINQANQGETASRNNGIKAATGEYIAFLDSDDFYFPNYLKKMIAAFEQSDCDLIQCGYVFERVAMTISNPYFEGNLLEAWALKNRFTVCINSFMVKQCLLTTHNIHFVPGRTMSGDFAFIVECAVFGKAKIIPDILTFYRYNQSSVSIDINGAKAKNDVTTRQAILAFVQQHYNLPHKQQVCAFLQETINGVAYAFQKQTWHNIQQGQYQKALDDLTQFGTIGKNRSKKPIRYAIQRAIINSHHIPLWKFSKLFKFL